MKIIDRHQSILRPTLADVAVGEVVRLKNDKLYLIGCGDWNNRATRYLINLDTGATHVIENGHQTQVTLVSGTFEVEGDHA